jgi:hypothetical protein
LLRRVANRRSDAHAIIAPAPVHTPSIAATIGCGHSRIDLTSSPVIRVKRRSCGMSMATSGPMISCTSPPEQKFPPSPVNTTALMSLACASLRKSAPNSAYASNVSGFFLSGRLSVIVATLPRAA